MLSWSVTLLNFDGRHEDDDRHGGGLGRLGGCAGGGLGGCGGVTTLNNSRSRTRLSSSSKANPALGVKLACVPGGELIVPAGKPLGFGTSARTACGGFSAP